MTNKNRNLEIHHCIASLHASTGGPVISVTMLCDYLAKAGISTSIHTLDFGPKFGGIILPNSKAIPVYFSKCWASEKLRFVLSFNFRKNLLKNSSSATLLHSHGIWLLFNHTVARVAKFKNLPHIISPRGMLENWSLKHKALKKKFVWYLYQKKDLQNCIAFCVTSNQEAESIRKLGFKQPIAVIPNGVDLPNLVPRKESENKVHYALFLSRLNPKKGVLDLIEAWNRLIKYGNKQIHNWQLKIVGPDEEGYKADVLRAIGEHNLQKKIIVLEPVYGDEKQKLFSEADLFILPTYSENFGNVIVEALAAEIPVITTKGAPWSELEEYQCGWWTDIGVEGCINALTKALALNDKERREMGKRGRKLVETKYSWASIAEKMISFYQWIINCGKKPGFVIDD